MDVLIAGGHGKVARHLIRILAAEGHRARGLIRNPEHAAESRPTAASPSCATSSATTSPRTRPAPTRSCSRRAPGPGSGVERKRTVDLGAAVKCVEAAEAHGVARFVIVSSIGAQTPDGGPEAMRPYLRAKADADARSPRAASTGRSCGPAACRTIPAPGSWTSRRSSGAAGRCRATTSRSCWRRRCRGGLRERSGSRARCPRRGRHALEYPSAPRLMKKIVEHHLAKLRRAQEAPEELDQLRIAPRRARIYPAGGPRQAGTAGADPRERPGLVLRGGAAAAPACGT